MGALAGLGFEIEIGEARLACMESEELRRLAREIVEAVQAERDAKGLGQE